MSGPGPVGGHPAGIPSIGSETEMPTAELPEYWQSEVDLKVKTGSYDLGKEMKQAAGHFIDDLGTQKAFTDLRRMAFLASYSPSPATQVVLDAQAAAKLNATDNGVVRRLGQFQESALGSLAYTAAHAFGASEENARKALDAGAAVSEVLPLAAGAGRLARGAAARDGRMLDGWHSAKQAASNERFAVAEVIQPASKATAAQQRVADIAPVPVRTTLEASSPTNVSSKLAFFDPRDRAIGSKPQNDGITFTPPQASQRMAAAYNEAELGQSPEFNLVAAGGLQVSLPISPVSRNRPMSVLETNIVTATQRYDAWLQNIESKPPRENLPPRRQEFENMLGRFDAALFYLRDLVNSRDAMTSAQALSVKDAIKHTIELKRDFSDFHHNSIAQQRTISSLNGAPLEADLSAKLEGLRQVGCRHFRLELEGIVSQARRPIERKLSMPHRIDVPALQRQLVPQPQADANSLWAAWWSDGADTRAATLVEKYANGLALQTMTADLPTTPHELASLIAQRAGHLTELCNTAMESGASDGLQKRGLHLLAQFQDVLSELDRGEQDYAHSLAIVSDPMLDLNVERWRALHFTNKTLHDRSHRMLDATVPFMDSSAPPAEKLNAFASLRNILLNDIEASAQVQQKSHAHAMTRIDSSVAQMNEELAAVRESVVAKRQAVLARLNELIQEFHLGI